MKYKRIILFLLFIPNSVIVSTLNFKYEIKEPNALYATDDTYIAAYPTDGIRFVVYEYASSNDALFLGYRRPVHSCLTVGEFSFVLLNFDLRSRPNMCLCEMGCRMMELGVVLQNPGSKLAMALREFPAL